MGLRDPQPRPEKTTYSGTPISGLRIPRQPRLPDIQNPDIDYLVIAAEKNPDIETCLCALRSGK